MGAKEYLQDKYPQMKGIKWNSDPNINDDWIASMMEEYAKSNKIDKEFAVRKIKDWGLDYVFGNRNLPVEAIRKFEEIITTLERL